MGKRHTLGLRSYKTVIVEYKKIAYWTHTKGAIVKLTISIK